MKRSTLFIFLAFLLMIPLFGPAPTAQAAGFVDVPSRALKEVNYLAEGGIANGASATTFASEKTVTRAEAAAFIGRALQLNGTKRVTNFKDVASGNFASGYIQSAVEKGILSGYSGGRFLPYNKVTRGEMAVMLSKAFGYEFGGNLSGAAKSLMTRGIAKGLEDGTFGADQPIIRADFSVFLARAINPDFRTKDTASFDKTLWVDVDDLNVRTGPSAKYAKNGSLKESTKILAGHEVGGWIYIKSDNLIGFAHKSYLRDAETGSSNRNDVDPRLANQTIILDPGHGGSDPGAIGFGLKEKDVVLDTGLKVNELLKDTPFKVYMTRTTDTYPTLSQRTSFAKSKRGNIFVSIHANASNGSGNGTETLYYSASKSPYSADSKLLATKIQQRMVAALKLKDRGIKNRNNLHVLTRNSMPAVLAELAFIDHKKENDMLKSDYWRTAAAKAIYLGVLDYYKAKGYEIDALYETVK
ncbi:N-acetylmuramoyl-L-alanine amidase [Bacillus badius]|uniref:N-acetylmuramoyl-L-alanine amidase n=1 Tax=Bacillus badius TaxID=1455 RepID=A0ABR5APU6_BACBA|nr:N-acetylmuramoyl-L-alanine amidase [Bacillus badius]KIL74796.1 N-acetylmuramoyl-L-alanine amidase [Bacillus badius]KIL75840.1 N-acetylmuramoyl-L-alanine amidase [Bacillus badius]MED4718512.1 N-acetylmuramoyl-L-alanine amidase [Bacillus badius]